jgi:pimeloyl-ACP methyl ester carboxylesterase
MQRKFSLFHKSDVKSTVKFFRKHFDDIEEQMGKVEAAHSKELERDLMIEKITKLIANVVMSKKTEEIMRANAKEPSFDGEKLLHAYFNRVSRASRHLLRIVRISIKGNKQMIFWIEGIEKKISVLKEKTGKSNDGMDNIYLICRNQLEFRHKTLGFFEQMEPIIVRIKKVADDDGQRHMSRYDAIREFQRDLYQVVKDELGIQDANVNLENLEEHEDKVCQYLEQYYFNRQRATTKIDTKLTRRRRWFKRLGSLSMWLSKSFRIDMIPITSAVIHYPRVLGFLKDFRMNRGMSNLRKMHRDRIKKSAVRIRTKRGIVLNGTYLEKEGCNKVVVMLHGLAFGRFSMLVNALEYNADYNILIFDMAGHVSSGGFGGLGVQESKDFVEVLNWLIDEKENTEIGVYGVSLGASAAIGGIARFPRQELVKAAVFHAAFADRNQTLDEYYVDLFKMPDCRLRKIIKYALDSNLTAKERDYKPKEEIKAIKCPIFLIHDIEDPMTRFHHAQDLARNVSPGVVLKTYFKHGNDHFSPDNKVKMYLVFQFLKRYLR